MTALEQRPLPERGTMLVRDTGEPYYSQGDGWTCPQGHGNPTNAPECRYPGCSRLRERVFRADQ